MGDVQQWWGTGLTATLIEGSTGVKHRQIAKSLASQANKLQQDCARDEH
jgi:hypothetical protein